MESSEILQDGKNAGEELCAVLDGGSQGHKERCMSTRQMEAERILGKGLEVLESGAIRFQFRTVGSGILSLSNSVTIQQIQGEKKRIYWEYLAQRRGIRCGDGVSCKKQAVGESAQKVSSVPLLHGTPS